MKGRFCIDNIHASKQVIEKHVNLIGKIQMIFIDFSKVFLKENGGGVVIKQLDNNPKSMGAFQRKLYITIQPYIHTIIIHR